MSDSAERSGALPLDRRHWLQAAGALLCFGPAHADGKAAGLEPAVADQLRVGMSMNNLLSLDPAAATGLDALSVACNLYDGLLETDSRDPARLRPALARATVLRVDAAVLQAWLQPQAGHALGEHLYVVDPMGNWMMRFAPNMDVHGASLAKRDLERLMRASSSWDTEGR